MIKSILREYGADWLVNRSLYSMKLKSLKSIPSIENLYEKKNKYPTKLDIFNIDVDSLRLFIKNQLSDEEKATLVRIADKACDGVIEGFSSIELNYGNPIDWQLNPLTNKRCDQSVKWYNIPDFDDERGDIKVIWEASRFSHFLTIGRAFLLTNDEKYYKAFSNQLKDWLETNPYSFGANYKCGQECSFRMINTLLAFTVFKECGLATDADTSNVKDLVDRCYRKIISNFFYAHKCIKNNHTISELMGMIVGAWCCEDQIHLKRGYKILENVISEQFTSDGGYLQFSFNYQRLALQDLEVIINVSNVTGIQLSDHSKELIGKSARLLYQCLDDSGDVPNYGNNDGALVFPVTSCGYRDFRPIINTVHALVTNKQLFPNGIYQEELIWFASRKKIEYFALLRIDKESSQFIEAGLFTFRNKKSWAMIIANDFHSRPAHMDQFHFDLWMNGINVLCDGGTYSYASDEGRMLIKNDSHNTAVVENVSQMNTNGKFMIYDWTKRKLYKYSNTYFLGEMKSVNGYRHIREVKSSNSKYVIKDKLNKDYSVSFHTPCDVSISDGKAVLSMNGNTVCVIESNGQMELKKSYRSLFYLKQEEIECLSIRGQADSTIKTIIHIKGEFEND